MNLYNTYVLVCKNAGLRAAVRMCRLNDLLRSYDRLEDVIPPCLLPVFKPYLKRAERVLLPGVTTHGWSSLVIDECMLCSLFSTLFSHYPPLPSTLPFLSP